MSSHFKPGVNLVEQTIVHQDARGIFSNIKFDVKWSEMNYVESISGVYRGNHYHQLSTELFVLLEGFITIESATVSFDGKGKPYKTSLMQQSFNAGQIFYISPMTWHCFYLEQPSKWFAMMSTPHASGNLDVVKLD